MNPYSRKGPIGRRDLSAALLALELLVGSGFIVKTGVATYAVRSLVEGTGIDIVNGDGVAGNATITLDLSETSTDALPEGVVNLYFTNERAQDAVGTILTNGGGITWTYDDTANTISGVISITSGSITDFAEAVDDRVSALLVEGAGIDLVYNDAGNSLTITVDLSELSTTTLPEGANLYYTEERVQDNVAGLIQNGTGISWVYSDPAGTLTPTVTLAPFSTTNLAEGSNLYFTDERAQDAIGTILTDSTTIDFTYDDAGNTITAIVIDNSISNDKLRDSAALSVIGRAANSVGDPADIAAAADDRVLARTGSALSFVQLTVGMFPNDLVTFAKIQNINTARVLGRTTAAAGDIEELSAGAGISIAGGTISTTITQYTDELAQDAIGAALLDTATIDLVYDDVGNTISANVIDASITFTKIQNINTARLVGRNTAAAGSLEELTIGGGLEFNVLQLRTTAFTGEVTKAAGGTALTIANDAVVFARMQDIVTDSLIGRDTAGTGDPENITVGGGIEFTGAGALRITAFTGDVTKGAGGTELTIANDAVTYAKMQNISATSRVLGRITVGAGDTEELTADNLITILTGADGDGSTLDADLLDAQHGSYYLDRANHTGQDVFDRVLSANFTIAADKQMLRSDELEIATGVELEIASGGILAIL